MCEFYQALYAVARNIPRGRVMTYGQIAAWLRRPRAAISKGSDALRDCEQRVRLESEGICFDVSGCCKLHYYQ